MSVSVSVTCFFVVSVILSFYVFCGQSMLFSLKLSARELVYVADMAISLIGIIFWNIHLSCILPRLTFGCCQQWKKWNCGRSYHHWFKDQIFCNVCYSEKKDDVQSASKVIKLILRVKCWYTKNVQPQYKISILLLGHLYWHLMMALPAQYEAWKPVTSQDFRFLGWTFLRLAMNIFKLKLQCNVKIWKPCMFVPSHCP